MKILLFGKTRTITRLTEDIERDLNLAGHEVRLFSYRSTKLEKFAEPWLLSPNLGVPLAKLMVRAVSRFVPDLILAIGPFHWLPPAVFDTVAAMPGRPPMVAWIADKFGPEAKPAARPFDLIAYSDSGLLPLHRQFGFRPASTFSPLAAARDRRGASTAENTRSLRFAFVASATPHRRALLAAVTEPVDLFGPDWRDGHGLNRHTRDGRKIREQELASIYRSHAGVLNIRNEENVVNGLNQRHFAPYIENTPVLTDLQTDLACCFDIGTEILTYRDAEELTSLLAAIGQDPVRARTIGAAGRRRVLAHHTYTHRVEALAALAGVSGR